VAKAARGSQPLFCVRVEFDAATMKTDALLRARKDIFSIEGPRNDRIIAA
jgi:hypothetical protein